MTLPRTLLVLCAVAMVPACAGWPEVPPPDYWPTSAWRSASPESQGVDSEVLAEALELVREDRRDVHSLLAIRHGYVVFDAAIFPYPSSELHDVADLTGVVTATLIGVAINRGDIQSIDQLVSSFFPEYAEASLGSPWRQVTIEHLLTMSSGLDCGIGHYNLTAMRRSADWTRFAFAMHLGSRPGARFEGCDVGMHLLSAILGRATGMNAHDYAEEHLFGPLGIERTEWPANASGVTHGWGDLRIHPRDLAKIGFLYLHNGRWEDRQILSSEWVEQATSAQMRVRIDYRRGYGYGWWMRPSPRGVILQARGRGGQRLVVWPTKDIVAVFTANGNRGDELGPLLISAVQSDRSLPENPEAAARLRELATAATGPFPTTPVKPLPGMASLISGQAYRLDDNPLGLRSFVLDFVEPDMARFEITLADPPSSGPISHYVLPIGLDGVARLSSDSPLGLIAALEGEWKSDHRFELIYGEANGANHCRFTMDFEETDVTLDAICRNGMFGNHMVVRSAMEPIAGRQTESLIN